MFLPFKRVLRQCVAAAAAAADEWVIIGSFSIKCYIRAALKLNHVLLIEGLYIATVLSVRH